MFKGWCKTEKLQLTKSKLSDNKNIKQQQQPI